MLFGHHHHGHDHGHGHDDHVHAGHDHAGHDHAGHDHAGHAHGPAPAPRSKLGLRLRVAMAALVVAGAALAACLVTVLPGEAVVLTRFGSPGRVLAEPGLSWRAPAPIEGTVTVDMRLRTTSAGLQDVGTKDGLRVLVQAYAAWQVADDPDHIRRFVRAVRNQPDEAAEQIRSFLGSALETTASRFPLSALINTDPSAVQLAAFEQLLRERVEAQVLDSYGIAIRQVGIERLTLPSETLSATVARMRAERQTVAAQRMAEGQRIASEIRANARAGRAHRGVGRPRRGRRHRGRVPREGRRHLRPRLRRQPGAVCPAALAGHAGHRGGRQHPHDPPHRRRPVPQLRRGAWGGRQPSAGPCRRPSGRAAAWPGHGRDGGAVTPAMPSAAIRPAPSASALPTSTPSLRGAQ